MVEERVGDIFKVRVGFEDNRRAASWKLSTIKLKDKTNGDEFSCDFNGWMEVNDALDGWREFTAVWPAIKILPGMCYQCYRRSVLIEMNEVIKGPRCPTFLTF